jgi:hypothetical protein
MYLNILIFKNEGSRSLEHPRPKQATGYAWGEVIQLYN